MSYNPIDFSINEMFAANISEDKTKITISIEDLDNLEKQANIILKIAIQHAYLSGCVDCKKNNVNVNNFFNKYYE